VLEVANPAGHPAVADFQVRALEHLPERVPE
jgi:hypothetical protein